MEDNKSQTTKDWWAPVWKGLVLDGEGKHYRRMKNALWLFLYFLLTADRGYGCLKRKIATIIKDTGFSRDMVMRWLSILRKWGYIETLKTGRCLSVVVKKWKTPSEVGNFQPQVSEISDHRSWKNPTIHDDAEAGNFSPLSQISPPPLTPIDRTIKKDKLKKIDIDRKNSSNSDEPFNGSGQERQYERLALDLADALDDLKGLPLYRSYAGKYPESTLRKVLERVMDIPAKKIKKKLWSPV